MDQIAKELMVITECDAIISTFPNGAAFPIKTNC